MSSNRSNAIDLSNKLKQIIFSFFPPGIREIIYDMVPDASVLKWRDQVLMEIMRYEISRPHRFSLIHRPGNLHYRARGNFFYLYFRRRTIEELIREFPGTEHCGGCGRDCHVRNFYDKMYEENITETYYMHYVRMDTCYMCYCDRLRAEGRI